MSVSREEDGLWVVFRWLMRGLIIFGMGSFVVGCWRCGGFERRGGGVVGHFYCSDLIRLGGDGRVVMGWGKLGSEVLLARYCIMI